MARLPPSTRVFAAGVGSRARMPLLASIARGAPAESVGDGYSAARGLRSGSSRRPRAPRGWRVSRLDLAGVERALPRELPPVGLDDSVLVVGRVGGARRRASWTSRAGDVTSHKALRVVEIDDGGDLRCCWGQGRMEELLAEGAGRASLVDIGRRYSSAPTRRSTS